AAIAEVEALWRRQPQYIWMGFLTYEVGVEALLKKSVRSGSLPELLLKRYPAVCELGDHEFRLHGDEQACDGLAKQLATPMPSQMLLSQESWPLQPLCTELSE